MAQARFSVRTAVAEGFDFWRQNWLKGIGALILAAVVGVVVQLTATPTHPIEMLGGIVLLSIAQLPAQAAFYRIALADLGAESPDRNGPLGLQWRMLETRLLGAGALIALLVFILALLGAFLMLALMAGFLDGVDPATLVSPEAVAAKLSPAGALVLNLFLLVFLIALIILTVRLSMVQAATAVANKTQVFSAAKLTKGAVAPIFGTMVLINLPLLLLQVVASLYAGKNIGLLTGMNVILSGIAPFFLIPISVGAVAYIYRRLRAPGGAA